MLLSSKTWQERRLKNIQKTTTRKVTKYDKNVIKKDVPKSVFFLIFWGLGPKAPQDGPKDSPEHHPKSNFVEKCIKMVCKILFISMIL